MTISEYIKKQLELTHVSTSMIQQRDNTNIVIEKCMLRDTEIVLIHDENGKVVVVC